MTTLIKLSDGNIKQDRFCDIKRHIANWFMVEFDITVGSNKRSDFYKCLNQGDVWVIPDNFQLQKESSLKMSDRFKAWASNHNKIRSGIKSGNIYRWQHTSNDTELIYFLDDLHDVILDLIQPNWDRWSIESNNMFKSRKIHSIHYVHTACDLNKQEIVRWFNKIRRRRRTEKSKLSQLTLS